MVPVNECFAGELEVIIVCSIRLEYNIKGDRLLGKNCSKSVAGLHLYILNHAHTHSRSTINVLTSM